MKSMKGKLLKTLKSIKPIDSLKQDRVLHVNAADGFIETLPKSPSLQAHNQTQFFCEDSNQEKAQDCNFVNQEPDIIDVAELMRDLEEQEDEMEVDGDEDDDDINDKENIRPPPKVKVREERGFGEDAESWRKIESGCCHRQVAPLSEIDTSSFRKPDLNSATLFDPNLLAAFEQAVKDHMKMSEAERQARTERENVERRKQEEEKEKEKERLARTEQENVRKRTEEETRSGREENGVEDKDEPPLKARRIEEDDEDNDNDNPLLSFEEKCPPGGSDSVVFYSTTLRGIRKTFEDCNSIRFLLESFRVLFYERDASMHMEFREELWRVLGGKTMPPRLFIKGRYVGGAEEVLTLHEQGRLRVLFQGVPINRSVGPCDGCTGFRFVLCFICNGSHRVTAEDGLSSECSNCNENGLIICPLCC